MFEECRVSATSIKDFLARYYKPDRYTGRGEEYARILEASHQADFDRDGYDIISHYDSVTGQVVAYFGPIETNTLADWLEEIGEANETWNDTQRRLILDTAAQHGQAWLGKINLYDNDKNNLVIWQWAGDVVYNFGCAFVIPAYDADLEKMILDRANAPYTGTAGDYPLVNAICNRIESLGGHCLVWS